MYVSILSFKTENYRYERKTVKSQPRSGQKIMTFIHGCSLESKYSPKYFMGSILKVSYCSRIQQTKNRPLAVIFMI